MFKYISPNSICQTVKVTSADSVFSKFTSLFKALDVVYHVTSHLFLLFFEYSIDVLFLNFALVKLLMHGYKFT